MSDQLRIETLSSALKLCRRRVLALEVGIRRFLDANAAGEMGNRDAAIAHLERLMERE